MSKDKENPLFSGMKRVTPPDTDEALKDVGQMELFTFHAPEVAVHVIFSASNFSMRIFAETASA